MKKKMKKLMCFAMLVLFLSACGQVKDEGVEYLSRVSEVNGFEDNKLSSMLESFDVVPLETDDDCLIGRVTSIKKRGGRYFVMSDRKNLHVFDGDGRFLFKVSNEGQGPGEYVQLCDYEADDQSIYLLDYKKMHIFDWDGKFVKTIPLNAGVRTIRSVKGGFLAYLFEAVDGNALAYIDKEGNVLQTALKDDENVSLVRWTAWPEWKEGCYVYHVSYSKNLYAFDEDKQVFRTLDVTDHPDALSVDEYAEVKKYNRNQREMTGMIFDGFCSSSSQLFWGSITQGKISFYVYDRKSDAVRSFLWADLEDDVTFTDGGLFNYIGSCNSDDEYLLSYMDADKLKEAVEERSGTYKMAYEKLKDVSEDHNPVIVLMKFR